MFSVLFHPLLTLPVVPFSQRSLRNLYLFTNHQTISQHAIEPIKKWEQLCDENPYSASASTAVSMFDVCTFAPLLLFIVCTPCPPLSHIAQPYRAICARTFHTLFCVCRHFVFNNTEQTPIRWLTSNMNWSFAHFVYWFCSSICRSVSFWDPFRWLIA